jgi:Bacterial Ig-like domain (group 2)
MTNMLSRRKRPIGVWTAMLLGLSCTMLQAQGTLQITSPPNGTEVHPGDTITVSVAANGGSFLGVVIFPSDPIEWSQVLSAPPYNFTLEIPTNIQPGPYNLRASGVITPGQPIESDLVTIDVERSDVPISTSTDPRGPVELSIGDQLILDVIGTYADGSIANLTASRQTTYISQASSIVTVSPTGLLTAISPGTTEIIVNGTLAIPVTVDPPISISPLNETVTASETEEFSATVTTQLGNPAVTWSINPPNLGSIDASGLYTAPDSIASQQTVTVTATSVADPSLSASTILTLSPAAFVNVSPGWSVVYQGQPQQFTATTANAGAAGLTWSISPANLGSITGRGLYTPPASVSGLQQVTVTATSIANPALSNSATMWVSPPPFQIAQYPLGVIVPQGSSSDSLAITQVASDNFSDPVAYSVSGLPNGVTANFGKATLSGDDFEVLTLTSAPGVAPGSYSFTITGTDTFSPGVTQTVNEVLFIQAAPVSVGFSLTNSSASASTMPDGTTALPVTATATDSFSHTIALSATGLPAGVTPTFSASPILAVGSATSMLTLTVGADVAPGTYPVTITGAEAATGTSQTASFTLIVLPLTVQSGALPAGWVSQDVGQPAVAGQSSFANGVFELQSAGTGVASAASTDQFQYAFSGLQGDGTVTARVLAMTKPDGQTGIMVRNPVDPGSAYVLLSVNNNSVYFTGRSSYGAASSFLGSAPDAVQLPVWLQLTRQGDNFAAAMSVDGVNWTPIADQSGNPITINVPMTANIYAGVIDTASADGSANTAALDNVTVRQRARDSRFLVP